MDFSNVKIPGNYLLRFYPATNFRCKALAVVLFLVMNLGIIAQNHSYWQINNELQAVRTISDKMAAEIYFGSVFSNTPSNSSILSTNIQRYFSIWAHYYYSPRWKLSSSVAYYRNKDVPDIGQYFSPEWRLSLQGTYYIHKTGYTLYTRMRGEFRYIMNSEGIYVDKYRYRQMLKFAKPINGKVYRKGVFYFLASEELYFKPDAKSTGITFFDRNRFEIGGGYLITDNLQLELAYNNEFLPRDDGNEIYNAAVLTLTFSNPITNLKKMITGDQGKAVQED
jgi:hypothetical protein